jgi:hypothetical protein
VIPTASKPWNIAKTYLAISAKIIARIAFYRIEGDEARVDGCLEYASMAWSLRRTYWINPSSDAAID